MLEQKQTVKGAEPPGVQIGGAVGVHRARERTRATRGPKIKRVSLFSRGI